MHNMEERIPRKKNFSYKPVRINSWAEVMDIEDSNDNRKMPAKTNKKQAKRLPSIKWTLPLPHMKTRTTSPLKKKGRAFFKSIAKSGLNQNLIEGEP
jgi:hypothetical protein